MNLKTFVDEREPTWRRLEAIVDNLARRGGRAPAEDAEQLIYLYRQVSADLARLRTAGANAQRVRHLNRLLSRAHAQLYRSHRSPRRRGSVLRFFGSDLPRLFRANAGYTVASLLICSLIYIMAYRTVQEHPEIISDILGSRMDSEFTGEKQPEDITARFREAQQGLTAPGFSTMITTNNIGVALTAFALGITFAIGTVWILVVNSAMLGGIAGAFAQSGIEGTLWATILPHGALELSAIVVAGAAGLRMGWPLWCPGQKTRLRALREGAGDAALLAVGLVPAFIVAGFIEGYVTPSDHLGSAAKLTIGFLAAAAFWAHLLLGGRRQRPDETAAARLTSAGAASTPGTGPAAAA